MHPPLPSSNRNRILIAAGAIAVLALVVFGVVRWGAYQQSIKIVDSCGNTAATLASPDLLQACATVSGRVIDVTPMSNGNLQVQLQLAQASSYATNTANQDLQGGNLVVILSCGTSTAVPTAYFQTCAAFHTTDIYPATQTPLTYTGNLVINQQFGWIQMQPVTEAPGV